MNAAARLVALWLLLTATTASAAARKVGYVTINCPVVGATIFINGQEIGVVPMDRFQLDFGKHVVEVKRPGLIDFRTDLLLRPGQTVVVNAIPKRAAALLTIVTNVRGGEVLLDGRSLGPLPIEERPITPGRHSLIIRKRGLKAYQENFLIGPHREYTSRPVLMKVDGTMAGGLLDLALDDDDDLPLEPAPPSFASTSPADDLSLDLDLEAPPALAAAPSSGGLDLELELDLPPPAPVAVAAAPAPAPKAAPPVVARPAPAPARTAPPAVARRAPPPARTTFVADPIAKEELEKQREPGEPLYMNKWVWAGTGAVVVAAVAIPILTGYTGGYQEVRNPEAACRDCLVVMNR